MLRWWNIVVLWWALVWTRSFQSFLLEIFNGVSILNQPLLFSSFRELRLASVRFFDSRGLYILRLVRIISCIWTHEFSLSAFRWKFVCVRDISSNPRIITLFLVRIYHLRRISQNLLIFRRCVSCSLLIHALITNLKNKI